MGDSGKRHDLSLTKKKNSRHCDQRTSKYIRISIKIILCIITTVVSPTRIALLSIR